MKKQTYKEQIKQLLLFGAEMHYKDVAAQTGIPVPSVRKELGQGAKKGTFDRVSKGVYTITDKEGTKTAYIHLAKCQDALPRMAEDGLKFDSVFLDPAYFRQALIGRNRIKKQNVYEFISPDDFAMAMEAITAMLRTDSSHVYLMLSGARTAQKDMDKYISAATKYGLEIVSEGSYAKLYPNGNHVVNIRGEITAPERLFLLTKSGHTRPGEIPDLQLNFTCVRPSVKKAYRTQKPNELIDRIILQSSFAGDTLLDPSAGSGMFGVRAALLKRFCHLIESSIDTITDFIIPNFQKHSYYSM